MVNGGDEQVFIQRCRSGDPHSLETLVRTHMAMVTSIAHRFATNLGDTEDLCQEIFLKVFRSLEDFQGRSTLKTWVYSISVAHCLDYRKQHARTTARTEALDLDVADGKTASPEAAAQGDELRRAVHLAVHTLPEKLREDVILRELEGLPHKDVATLLAIPQGTVFSRLNKARALLQQKLARYL